jgi:hypothetical protein
MRLFVLLFFTLSGLLTGKQPPPFVSPVDQRIAAARQQVTANPKEVQTYNDLAFGLCRKARDTSDVSLYTKAAAALKRSLDLSPGNYDAMKLRVVVFSGSTRIQARFATRARPESQNP